MKMNERTPPAASTLRPITFVYSLSRRPITFVCSLMRPITFVHSTRPSDGGEQRGAAANERRDAFVGVLNELAAAVMRRLPLDPAVGGGGAHAELLVF